MTCTWLDEHPHEVVDALWGDLPESAPLWDHLRACPHCAQAFYELDGCVETLRQTPWAAPPRIIYLKPREPHLASRRLLQRSLMAAAVLIGLGLGFVVGNLYYRSSHAAQQLRPELFTRLQAEQQAHIDAALAHRFEDFERRFWQEHQRIITELVARLDQQEANLMQVQNDLLKLQRRHSFWVQNTQSQIESLIRAVNSGGQ